MGYQKYNGRPPQRSRQEISRVLKYIIFFINFIFWVCGIVCIGLGIYLYSNDFRPVLEAIDFFMNPSILLILAGCIVFVISFLGCTGALRENVCMLKLFSFSLFMAYICLVILAFVVFILFYSDSKTGISIQTLLQNAVIKYNENKNMADLMDAIQMQLYCCGAGSLGYKDWNMNSLYNCSKVNSSPERCGVPYSCCKRSTTTATSSNTGVGGVVQDTPPNNSPSVMCGFGAQDKSIAELQNVIYVDGCVQPLQRAFEGHAVIIGAVIGAIIVPVCMSVTFSNILAKQIQRQKYLLDKEARKEERRRRNYRKKSHDLEHPPVDNQAAIFQLDEEARRKATDNCGRKSSADLLSNNITTAAVVAENSAACKHLQPKNGQRAEYRQNRKPNGQHRPLGEHKRKRPAGDPKRRQRTSSADAVRQQVPKRKRRSKSQEPNTIVVGEATTSRKMSDNDIDKLQIENQVNQELERARTPINP